MIEILAEVGEEVLDAQRRSPQALFGAETMRSRIASEEPSNATALSSPVATTTPTSSWPSVIGHGLELAWSVPGRCSVS